MSLELVYAVHDYNAELEDELSLRIGECIAVVEKDEEHNDGWWTGRNSVGQVGLFPLNYTTNVPPSNAPNRSPSIRSAGSIRSSKSIRSPKTFRSSNDVLKPIGPLRLSSVSERPSQANTRRFTDIYLAINTQLSNHRRSRSSSAYSSALSSESNYDGDDTDRFKRARAQLAERARLQLEEARARENDLDLHIKLPSIDTSMYSESDSEDESIRARLVDDDDGYKLHSPLLRQGSKDTLCSPDSGVSATKPALIVPGSTLMTDSPLTLSPVGSGEPQTPSSAGSTAPVPNWSLGPVQPPPFSPLARTPSIISSKVSPPTPVSPSCHEAQPNPVDVSAAREASSSPLAWSISEVQDWLKLWEFSDDVCRKFIEHEVSGEVLLALDDEILKTELGIIPFTLRRQVVTAIADLMSVQPAAPKRNSIILAQPPSPPGPVAASSAAPTVFSARSSSTTAAPLPPTTVTGPLAPRVPVTRPTLRVITSRPASTVRLVPPSPNAQSPEPELPLTPPWSPSPASPTIARSNPLASVARPPATGSIAVNVKPAVAPMAVSTPPQLVPAHGISRISAPHSNVGPSVPPSLMPAALCPTQTLAKPAKPRSPIIAAFMSPPSSSAHNPPAPPARRPSGARRMPVRRQSSYVQPIVADSRYPAEIRLRPTSALPPALTPGFAGGSTSRSSHALAQRIPSNHAVRRIRPLPPISEPFRQSRNAPTSTALIAAPTFLPPGAARPMPPGNRQSRPVPDLYQDVMAAARGVKRERISELPAPVFRLPAQTSSMQGYGIPRALISGRPAL